MLVLTRKLDEQILIGDNIKVTLIRVKGNTVRIGIEAPRDVRIVRGELQPLAEAADDQEGALTEREHAFAHPELGKAKLPKKKSPAKKPTGSRMPMAVSRIAAESNAEVFVGTVKASGGKPSLKRVGGERVARDRAPLANFVSAS